MPNARSAGGRAVERAPRKRRPSPGQPKSVTPKMVDPLIKRLYLYWQDKSGGRAMPARADLDPLEMRSMLGYLMLIDVVPGPLRFRVRLQGTELLWWVGRELTGLTLAALPRNELVTFAERCLSDVVATGAPYHWIGRHDLDGVLRRYEALILPLASDGSRVDMLLAGVRCRGRFPEQ